MIRKELLAELDDRVIEVVEDAYQLGRRDAYRQAADRLEFLAAMQSPRSFDALRKLCEQEAKNLRKKTQP